MIDTTCPISLLSIFTVTCASLFDNTSIIAAYQGTGRSEEVKVPTLRAQVSCQADFREYIYVLLVLQNINHEQSGKN